MKNMPIVTTRNTFRLLVLVAFATACSDSDDDSSSPCTGSSVPDQATLCKLEVGKSTKSDALKVLGPPLSSTGDASLSRLSYSFGNLCASPVSLSLIFDETGTLDDAITHNLTRPDCWEEDEDEL